MRSLAAVASFAAALWLGGPLGVAAPVSGPTLRLVESQVAWSALDPQVGTYYADAWSLLHATCTTLVTYPDRSGLRGDVLQPDGAAAYPRISADGRRYTFTVRSGLRFNDGTPVTAANYAHAIGRLLNPLLHSDMAFYGAGIVSARGRGRTLTIRLKAAAGDLLSRLALPMFCPVPTNYPADPGITLTVGSGPYYVASAVPFRSVVLRPNRAYPGPRRHPFGAISLTIGGTPESNAAAVTRGRYDYSFDGVPPSLGLAMVKRYGVGRGALYYKPFPGIVYLPFNLQGPLFRNNVRLRRAVEYAVDRSEVVRQLAPFNGRRLGQLIPPVFPGHGGDVFPLAGANLKVARRLASGHLRRRILVFYTFASPGFVRVADIIAYNLRQIGLEVEIRTFAARVEQQKLLQAGERWDLGTSLWYADYADASQFVTPIIGPESPSPLRTPRFQARLRAASRLSGAARTKAFAALAQSALQTEAPVVPLYSFAHLAGVSARLSCVSFNTMTELNLAGLCVRSKRL
jgi:ABC-type transport system substrate-binding protein